jgi:hypothetical protein
VYTQPIDRAHPGCIIFLVDRSTSMEEPLGASSASKADSLAQAVNRLVRNLVLQCQRGEQIRDYYHLGLIGYGATVGSIFGGDLAGHNLVPISRVADYPLRLLSETLPDSPNVSLDRPIWLEPVANGGTPMVKAIDTAGAVVVDWANEHFDSFPPIVINVSDGAATDGDPRSMAEQLRNVHTRDGALLLFNVNVSSSPGPAVQYANTPRDLPDAYARTLFEMSSELTPYMVAVARGMGLVMGEGARGFVFNADSGALSEFLDVGTRVSQVTDR